MGLVRPSDTVARLGGDEFVVVCNDLMASEQASAPSPTGSAPGSLAAKQRLTRKDRAQALLPQVGQAAAPTESSSADEQPDS